MTATNKCYNFVGFRCRPPLSKYQVRLHSTVGTCINTVRVVGGGGGEGERGTCVSIKLL